MLCCGPLEMQKQEEEEQRPARVRSSTSMTCLGNGCLFVFDKRTAFAGRRADVIQPKKQGYIVPFQVL